VYPYKRGTIDRLLRALADAIYKFSLGGRGYMHSCPAEGALDEATTRGGDGVADMLLIGKQNTTAIIARQVAEYV
jgi:hypothetical protein